jgi:hypothetical protein
LPLDQAQKFSVFERQQMPLSIGDQVRFTKNVKHRMQRFPNNELRTVVGIDEAKIIFDKGEIVCNGAALHIDQGITVTSHASQAKTVDRVIVSVPVRSFSQANEAQFYVSMSRARWAMHVFTDSIIWKHLLEKKVRVGLRFGARPAVPSPADISLGACCQSCFSFVFQSIACQPD